MPEAEAAGAFAETFGTAAGLGAFDCDGAEDFAATFSAATFGVEDALLGESFVAGVEDVFFAGATVLPSSFVGFGAATILAGFFSETFRVLVGLTTFLGICLEGFAAIERAGAPFCLAEAEGLFETTFPEAALGVGLAGGFCAGFFDLAGAAVGVVFLEGTERRAVKFSFFKGSIDPARRSRIHTTWCFVRRGTVGVASVSESCKALFERILGCSWVNFCGRVFKEMETDCVFRRGPQ